jgi:hypothetical protein
METEKTKPSGENANIQQAALNIWIEQSKLLWSRLQTASVIEGATLAGWYQVRTVGLLPQIVLVFGTLLLFILALIMRRDVAYLCAAKRKAGDLLPCPPECCGMSGRRLALLAISLLIIGNLLLAIFCMYIPPLAKP